MSRGHNASILSKSGALQSIKDAIIGSMEKSQILERSAIPALSEKMAKDLPALTAEWQRRLEELKNNISIFVPVGKRQQGLLHTLELLAAGIRSGDLAPFCSRSMAITRLRAGQGFNLKDSLEEALVLEDLLFHWACKTLQSDREQTLEAIALVHRISHTIVQDIARVHVQAMDRNLHLREQESFTDGLTHLFNYRFFKEFLQKEIYRSSRYQHPASLVLTDVDFFKKLNDKYGHVGGDQILMELARLAQSNCRMTDLVCRYGGEEFAILLPETPKDQAILYCERLRSTIEKHPFRLRNAAESVGVTISVGLANYPEDSEDPNDLIRKADQAMYIAKHGGRNRVCFYAQDGAPRTA